jgi:hypothetical protein
MKKQYKDGIKFLSEMLNNTDKQLSTRGKYNIENCLRRLNILDNRGVIYFSMLPVHTGAFLLYLAGIAKQYKTVRPIFSGKKCQVIYAY